MDTSVSSMENMQHETEIEDWRLEGHGMGVDVRVGRCVLRKIVRLV